MRSNDPARSVRLGSALQSAAVIGLLAFNVLEYEQNLRASVHIYAGLLGYAVFFAIASLKLSVIVRGISLAPVLVFALATMTSLGLGLLAGSSLSSFTLIKLVSFPLILFGLAISIDQETYKKIKISYTQLVVALSILGCIIVAFEEFLFWGPTQVGRFSSLVHDPNYYGAIAGLGVLMLWLEKEGDSGNFSGKTHVVFLAVLLTSLLFSYSKSAVLALALSVVFYWSVRYRARWLLFPLLVTTAAGMFLLVRTFVNAYLPSFRIDDGTNGRAVFLQIAFDELSQRPFHLRDAQQVHELIVSNSFRDNISLHNTYIESAYLYGLPFLLGLLVICFWAAAAYYKRKQYKDITYLLFLGVMSNTFTFIPAGVGLLSVMFVVILLGAFLDD